LENSTVVPQRLRKKGAGQGNRPKTREATAAAAAAAAPAVAAVVRRSRQPPCTAAAATAEHSSKSVREARTADLRKLEK